MEAVGDHDPGLDKGVVPRSGPGLDKGVVPRPVQKHYGHYSPATNVGIILSAKSTRPLMMMTGSSSTGAIAAPGLPANNPVIQAGDRVQAMFGPDQHWYSGTVGRGDIHMIWRQSHGMTVTQKTGW